MSDDSLEGGTSVLLKVAHDLSSPLLALNVVMEMISDLPDQQRSLLKKAIRRIVDVTRPILTQRDGRPALYGAGSLNPVALGPVVEDAVDWKRVEIAAKSCVTLTVRGKGPKEVAVLADPAELREILSNAMNNAIEALPRSGGKVAVEVSVEEKWARVSIINPARKRPTEFLKRFEDRPTRFTSKKGGNGLGLLYARQILESWGGAMEVSWSPDEGTRVTVKVARPEA